MSPYTCNDVANAYQCTQSNCTPNWTSSAWSTCVHFYQTRSWIDSNKCGVGYGLLPVSDTYLQTCNPYTCQNASIPGANLDLSCINGQAPYTNNNYMEMSYSDLQAKIAPLQTVLNSISVQPSCDCVISNSGGVNKAICPASTSTCNYSLMPMSALMVVGDVSYQGKTYPGFVSAFVNPCTDDFGNEIGGAIVTQEWISKIASGESVDQAYQDTVAYQTEIEAIVAEENCIRGMVTVYYIGGQPGSTNWMATGQKYRQWPNPPGSSTLKWQEWINGAWTFNLQ